MHVYSSMIILADKGDRGVRMAKLTLFLPKLTERCRSGTMQSCTERLQSGHGLHIILKGKLPGLQAREDMGNVQFSLF